MRYRFARITRPTLFCRKLHSTATVLRFIAGDPEDELELQQLLEEERVELIDAPEKPKRKIKVPKYGTTIPASAEIQKWE